MDYPTAAFLAVLALVGLVSVVIHKVNPHQPKTASDNNLRQLIKTLHQDNNRISQLLEAMPVAIGSEVAKGVAIEVARVALPSTTVVMESGKSSSFHRAHNPKFDRVRAWLVANPNTVLSNREIAVELGVSHTLVNQVRKLIAG